MAFDAFAGAHATVLWSIFGIALLLGAVVNKTNFCTMGAVSDLVNIGDTGRIRAWIFAMAVAIVGMIVLEGLGVVDLNTTRPLYRSTNFAWVEYVIGGIMFGVGMTYGSGCGNKTLIRIGGGNLKSVLVMLTIAVCAYFMINPFPGTDQTIYSAVFYPWSNPMSLSLSESQDLGSLLGGLFGGAEPGAMRLWLGAIIALLLLIFVFKSADFRNSFDNILGGLAVGLAVVAAWYVTSSFVTIDADGELFSWVDYASDDNWSMLEEDPRPRSIGVQSFTFINPMGESLGLVAHGFNKLYVTFGVAAFVGVIAGSLLWSLISHGFRFEWFVNAGDFVRHLLGGVLMGIGGVLALGCTIGQAVTGVSTLALGSFIAFASIVFGSAMTMKIQYYKMVYEDEASFMKAFVTALVDFKLLPAGMRKLEAI